MTEAMLTLEFSRDDLGQIGECLELRRDAWQNTVTYLTEGVIDEPMVPDCTKIQEAVYFASTYERLAHTVAEKLRPSRSH